MAQECKYKKDVSYRIWNRRWNCQNIIPVKRDIDQGAFTLETFLIYVQCIDGTLEDMYLLERTLDSLNPVEIGPEEDDLHPEHFKILKREAN